MQHDRDGQNTVRVSCIISENNDLLDGGINVYRECIEKSLSVAGVEQGEWRDLADLSRYLGKW